MTPRFLIGIDEVGRGPIAGPVTVCALALSYEKSRRLKKFLKFTKNGELKDSKRMTRTEREVCASHLRQEAKKGGLYITLAHVTPKVLDRIGIVSAIRLATRRCLKRLKIDERKCRVLLDGGLKAPKEYIHQRTIIKGDQTVGIIAMASVYAKVSRDRRMTRLAKRYPGYLLESHVGYGTKKHYDAIRKLGISDLHRKSFLRGFDKRSLA